jgi:hypothetical protein
MGDAVTRVSTATPVSGRLSRTAGRRAARRQTWPLYVSAVVTRTARGYIPAAPAMLLLVVRMVGCLRAAGVVHLVQNSEYNGRSPVAGCLRHDMLQGSQSVSQLADSSGLHTRRAGAVVGAAKAEGLHTGSASGDVFCPLSSAGRPDGDGMHTPRQPRQSGVYSIASKFHVAHTRTKEKDKISRT